MKPHKISEEDLDKLEYPVVVQPKLDGIRCLIVDGEVLSYTLRPIPNRHIVSMLKASIPKSKIHITDGELVLGPKATFQEVQSAVMSRQGEPVFSYIIFDVCSLLIPDMHYIKRIDLIECDEPWLVDIRYGSMLCHNKEQVLRHEKGILESGLEGIIIRAPYGYYKFGRSTLNEGYLLALKRFNDAEAVIVDCLPMEKNTNEQEEDNHGHAKRSSEKEGMVKLNTLGSLEVRGVNGKFKGKLFNIGGGFTFKQRDEIWEAHKKGNVHGTVVKYKYFDVGSTNDAPRQPIFLGFRDSIDN